VEATVSARHLLLTGRIVQLNSVFADLLSGSAINCLEWEVDVSNHDDLKYICIFHTSTKLIACHVLGTLADPDTQIIS
jgi:hypothetical protein